MHICFCSDECPPDTAWGGIATYISEASRALAAQGHRVTVLTTTAFRYGRTHRLGKARVVRLALPSSVIRGNLSRTLAFSMRCELYLRRLTSRGDRPDVIEYPDWLGQGVFRGRVPAVIRLHAAMGVLVGRNAYTGDFGQRAICALEATSLWRKATLVANSHLAAAETREACGIQHNRPIRVVPCPLDTVRFTPATERVAAPTVLFVGRLDRAKGAGTFFTALKMLLPQFPDLRCIVVGSGFDATSDGRWRFRERIDWLLDGDRKAAAAVTFTGEMPRDSLPSFYRRASVVVAPSLFESFGYVALEAMACGRPVVLSRTCGLAELVEDGISASLVQPEDAAGVAARIAMLLEDRNLADKLGKRGREVVSEYCRSDVVGRQLLRVYEEARDGDFS